MVETHMALPAEIKPTDSMVIVREDGTAVIYISSKVEYVPGLMVELTTLLSEHPEARQLLFDLRALTSRLLDSIVTTDQKIEDIAG